MLISMKGAVIPVTAGVMRNIWYPKKMADYLTAAKLQKLGIKKDTVIERDTNFRSNTERKLRKQDEEKAEEIDSDTNTAQSAYEPAPEQIAPVELDLLGVRPSIFSWGIRECLLMSNAARTSNFCA